jgi:hypothetical protein
MPGRRVEGMQGRMDLGSIAGGPRNTTVAMVALLALGLACLSGCVGYTTYSGNSKDARMLRSPNTPGVRDVVVASTRWIMERYPPSGKPNPLRDPSESPTSEEFALNLPPGLSERTTRKIVESLAPGARAMVEENAKLPVYHISYIRIRGDEADVYAFRPVYTLGLLPSGEPPYQEMRLRLRGGLRSWHVVYGMNWMPGTGVPPPIHFVDREEEESEEHASGEASPTNSDEPSSESGLELGGATEGGSPGVVEPIIDLPYNPIWDTPTAPK